TSTDLARMVGRTTHVEVSVDAGTVTVAVDGAQLLSKDVSLPGQILVGFTAGTGGLADRHAVTALDVLRIPRPGPVGGSGWTLTGGASAAAGGTGVDLTQADETDSAGTTFVNEPLPINGLQVAFDTQLSGGAGADGLALVVADPALGATAASLGASGGGLGFA